MLAAAGAEVRAVATTASERSQNEDTLAYLATLGIKPEVLKGHTSERTRPELEFVDKGVSYRLLDIGRRRMHEWQKLLTRQFDLIYDDELYNFKPDILVTFGGLQQDERRFERARRQGTKICFMLRNEGYLNGGEFLARMDAILTPSQYLSDLYEAAVGVKSTPLPVPLELDDVIAPEHDPIFFTMINPSREKGLCLMARLAEELSNERPDIPLLIIESRGSAGNLVKMGLSGGFDLRRHENLMMSPALAQPKEIYLATRALLVPSLWHEPAGRVAPEALLNGIPPLVSDRGGLPEVTNGAGFVLSIPPEITPHYPRPVPSEAVRPWLELIYRLEGDAAFYEAESQKAREAGKLYRPENLVPRYLEFFAQLLN
jgi:glycosyltransferase involved in cell wall biosynthesis